MSAESDSLQSSSNSEDSGFVRLADEDVAVAVDRTPSVGQLLKSARESKRMSLEEVAERLKLSKHQVAALESDDWSRMQCNAITRGFVRNYARLVTIDAAPLMTALDQVGRSQTQEFAIPESINVKVPRESSVSQRDYARIATGAVVLTVAVLAYFFVPPDVFQTTYSMIKERLSSKPVAESTEVTAPEPKVVESAPAASVPVNPTAVVDTPPATQQQSQSLPVIEQPAAQTPVADAKQIDSKAQDATLKFNFGKAAWVEVKDRSGQIVFSQLSPSGSQREVVGQPPFSLIIGNAGNVSLQYKGKDIDLSKRSKDDVARLTLE